MFGIYKTINDIFSDMLNKHGYQYFKVIKSNIHPSIIYTCNNYELQIGFNYESHMPFAISWGRENFECPLYVQETTDLSMREKIYLYSIQIDDYFKTQFEMH